MLTRSYVCRRCQAKSLRQAAAADKTQWLAKASYISLSQPVQQATQASPDDQDDTAETLRKVGDRDIRTKYNRSREPTSRKSTVGRPTGRYSGSAIPLPFDRRRSDLQTARPRGQNGQRQSAGIATKLDDLLNNPDTLREAWTYFLHHYARKDSPNLLNPAYQDLRHLQYGEVFKKLLQALATAWAASPVTLLPQPTTVVREFEELGIWRSDFWEVAGWSLAKRIFILNHQEVEGQQATIGELSNELVELWLRFLGRHGKHTKHKENEAGLPSLNWQTLQQRAGHNVDTDRRSVYFETRFAGFLYGFESTSIQMPALALITCDLLLTETMMTPPGVSNRDNCAELLKTLLLLVNGKNVARPAESLRKILGNFDGAISPLVIDDYVRNMHQLPDRALAMITTLNSQSSKAPDEKQDEGNETQPLSPEESLQKMFSARIQRTESQQNATRMQQLWEQLKASYRKEERGEVHYEIPALLYDQIISALFALRRGDVALEIWKVMVENGTQPTTKTWTAMLDGANKARDFPAAEGIWQRMIASKVQLDEVAWIVRVTSLVHHKKHKEALATLADLGRRWVEATRTQSQPRQASSPPAVKPNIQIVNAVIAPLAKMRNSQMLTQVLGWAKNFGLKPTSYTFNALISGAIAKRQSSDVNKLLQQMSAQGVEPDEATCSIILDHLLINAPAEQSLSSEQIQDTVVKALEALEAHGLKATNHIYSQLIDRLLRHHNNLTAAQAVLALMFERNLEPSEHAYTSLVTYYFSLEQPDVKSVTDIVDRLESKFRRVNTYFYDRVLQGYAATDSISLVMRTLRRMSKEGRHPSWQALRETLSALERAEEWHLLGELVTDVEGREGIDAPGPDEFSKTQKSKFYGMVWRLREEGKIAPHATIEHRNTSLQHELRLEGSADSSLDTAQL